ncbi:hypothetical protein MLD38_017720 [Melastoma candidum]|uniref:Uncharacterized protein n=1 Tax=Melastoma candidum TaxID=119954 RepID=A0ACB9QV24_9MYRT|nr:hypothetical protein MLD38_017720 [Melastoma candidum]
MPSLLLHILVAFLVLSLSLSPATAAAPQSANTNGSDGETPDLRRLLLEDVDTGGEMESETSRRLLMMQPVKRYISYETLRRDMVPCTNPGASYYNCEAGRSRANPYTRGCEVITGCARIIKDDRN